MNRNKNSKSNRSHSSNIFSSEEFDDIISEITPYKQTRISKSAKKPKSK